MEIYQKYQGRQKSTFKISKYVIILSTDLNITRLECKVIQLPQPHHQYNQFEYHQIGM